MPHTAACWRWSASWLTAIGRSARLEGSDLDQHLQQTPFTLCALTAAIILPRAAIVSFLWMSQHQSPDYPKSDVTRNHNEGLNYLSYLFTNWNWNLMNFKNMLLGEKVILLSWCIWICTCKLCLQRVYLLLKLLGDFLSVCALCVSWKFCFAHQPIRRVASFNPICCRV